MIFYDKMWPDDENFSSHQFVSSAFKKYCGKCGLIVTSRTKNNSIKLTCWYLGKSYTVESNTIIPSCEGIIAERNMNEALE